MLKSARVFAVLVIIMLILTTGASGNQDIRVAVSGKLIALDSPAVEEEGRVLVPFRAIAQALGAQVEFSKEKGLVIMTSSKGEITLTLNSRVALVNGQTFTLDVPAQVREGRTLVPLRFVGEHLGEEIHWDKVARAVFVGQVFPLPALVESNANGQAVTKETKIVKIGSKSLSANVIKVNLQDPKVRIKVGLAQDKIGGTEDLLSLAKRKGAVAAINGTFFNAYTKEVIKDPVGTVITNGQLVHKGATGTVFAINPQKAMKMEPVRFKLEGATEGSYKWPNNWYAYWINRAPTTTNHAAIYTSARGDKMGVKGGKTIVVENGVVTQITSGDVKIPKQGYVLNFQGSEATLGDRFALGTAVSYRVVKDNGDSLGEFWGSAQEGLGAGPKLVTRGKASFSIDSAKKEGFTEAKILTNASSRSALGFTSKGELLLVTVGKATMSEMAQLMQTLGAVEAMNLDGGASSGLVYQGKYITKTGRNISNALLVYQ